MHENKKHPTKQTKKQNLKTTATKKREKKNKNKEKKKHPQILLTLVCTV